MLRGLESGCCPTTAGLGVPRQRPHGADQAGGGAPAADLKHRQCGGPQQPTKAQAAAPGRLCCYSWPTPPQQLAPPWQPHQVPLLLWLQEAVLLRKMLQASWPVRLLLQCGRQPQRGPPPPAHHRP